MSENNTEHIDLAKDWVDSILKQLQDLEDDKINYGIVIEYKLGNSGWKKLASKRIAGTNSIRNKLFGLLDNNSTTITGLRIFQYNGTSPNAGLTNNDPFTYKISQPVKQLAGINDEDLNTEIEDEEEALANEAPATSSQSPSSEAPKNDSLLSNLLSGLGEVNGLGSESNPTLGALAVMTKIAEKDKENLLIRHDNEKQVTTLRHEFEKTRLEDKIERLEQQLEEARKENNKLSGELSGVVNERDNFKNEVEGSKGLKMGLTFLENLASKTIASASEKNPNLAGILENLAETTVEASGANGGASKRPLNYLDFEIKDREEEYQDVIDHLDKIDDNHFQLLTQLIGMGLQDVQTCRTVIQIIKQHVENQQ